MDTAYIVDDDKGFRESLAFVLDAAGIRYEAFDCAESFLLAYDGGSGCILLDVRMGAMSGLELQQLLQQREIDTPVILLTGHGNVPMAVKAVQNGVFEFFEKPFDAKCLVDTVKQAFNKDRLQRTYSNKTRLLKEKFATLSNREQEVFSLLAKGYSNKEMASTLSISVRTLEVHRLRVLKKLACKNAVDISKFADRIKKPGHRPG